MAGLFSIFNESESNSNLSLSKGKDIQSCVSTKLKSFGNVPASAKPFVQTQIKPKGLSVRSKSDLNVSYSNNLESNKLNSKEYMKCQSKDSIPNKSSKVPIKTKMSKSKSFVNIVGKKLSPKISSPIMQNVVDNFVFAKPEIPRNKKRIVKCSEPEKLSYFFDHYKYMTDEIDCIFTEERRLLKAARKLNKSITKPEDEGFISGSEIDSFEFKSKLSLSESCLKDIELPEISDIEE